MCQCNNSSLNKYERVLCARLEALTTEDLDLLEYDIMSSELFSVFQRYLVLSSSRFNRSKNDSFNNLPYPMNLQRIYLLGDIRINVKLLLCFIKHDYVKTWGNGSISPHVLNHGHRWKWVVSSIVRLLYFQGQSQTSSYWTGGLVCPRASLVTVSVLGIEC